MAAEEDPKISLQLQLLTGRARQPQTQVSKLASCGREENGIVLGWLPALLLVGSSYQHRPL